MLVFAAGDIIYRAEVANEPATGIGFVDGCTFVFDLSVETLYRKASYVVCT